MTTTPPDAPTGSTQDPGDGGPRVTREEIRDLGRLRRTRDDRKIAGVAGGLARHLDVDPVIIRVTLVVLVFFGGAGLLIYGACWLLVPEEDTNSAKINLDERSRTVALAIVAGVAAVALIGDSWGVIGFPWPLAVVAAIALVFLTRRGTSGPTTVSSPPPGGYATPPAAPATPATPYQPGPTWTHQATTWAPPPTYAAPAGPTLPRNPRKRGPILFWFTLALITLAEGLLGVVDLAGASVAGPAYPALALGITSAMLLLGAFWGRAGGLILLGLVASLVLAGVTAAQEVDGDTIHERPLAAAGVQARYEMDAGELRLDLSDVRDLAALDGRSIHLDGDVGRIEVIVPRGLDVQATGTVSGPGHVLIFGQDRGGIDTTYVGTHDGGQDAPALTIDAELSIGEIEVRLASVPFDGATVPSPTTRPGRHGPTAEPVTPDQPSPRSHR